MIKPDFQEEPDGGAVGGWLKNLQRERWQMKLFVAFYTQIPWL